MISKTRRCATCGKTWGEGPLGVVVSGNTEVAYILTIAGRGSIDTQRVCSLFCLVEFVDKHRELKVDTAAKEHRKSL